METEIRNLGRLGSPGKGVNSLTESQEFFIRRLLDRMAEELKILSKPSHAKDEIEYTLTKTVCDQEEIKDHERKTPDTKE